MIFYLYSNRNIFSSEFKNTTSQYYIFVSDIFYYKDYFMKNWNIDKGENHRRHFSSTNSVSVIVINYDILHWVNYLGITILTGFEL